MKPKELALDSFLDTKILRFFNPKMNTNNIPLNGVYNAFENLETDTAFLLDNKMKNFDIGSSKCVSVDNMFTISTSFGKVLLNDKLEALILFFNKSDEAISLNIFKILVNIEQKNSSPESRIPFQFPKQEITIDAHQYISFPLSLNINCEAKYSIEIEAGYCSQIFNNIYNKERQINQVLIKTVSQNYRVESGRVVRLFYKTLYFETINPFKVKEKWHNQEMKQCLVEISIDNQALIPLRLLNIELCPKNKTEMSIQMFNHDKYTNMLIEQEEQLNSVFQLTNPAIYNIIDTFYLIITWTHLFDSIPKKFQVEIKNNLNIFNNCFSISVSEQPNGDIFQNQNFKVIFQLENKKKNLLIINVMAEKINDRDIDVIDIVEKDFTIFGNGIAVFCLICKCDILGTVNLPRLTLTSTEEGSKSPFHYVNLLSFNCVKEITLI